MPNRRGKPAVLAVDHRTPATASSSSSSSHFTLPNGASPINGKNGKHPASNQKKANGGKSNGSSADPHHLSEDAGAGTSSLPRSRSSSFGFGYSSSSTSTVEEDEREDSPPMPFWSVIACADGRGSLNWLGLGVVCSMLTLISLGIHLLLDLLGEQLHAVGLETWYTTLGVVAVLLAVVSVPLTHGLGQKKYSVYKLFQPFVGGLRFVVLQVIAWTLWTVTVLGGIYGVWVGGKKLTAGWLSAVGIGGVVSQILVLISLHFFVSNVSTTQRTSVAEGQRRRKVQEVEERTRQQEERRRRKGGKKGRKGAEEIEEEEADATIQEEDASSLAAPSSTTSTPLTDAASSSMWPYSSLAMKATFLVIATSSLLLAAFVESAKDVAPSTRASLQSLLTSAILLAVPITHLLARRSLTHAGYLLFQPFKGGRKFVALQAIAWTLWTLAFISAGMSFVLFALKKDDTAAAVAGDDASDASRHPTASMIPWDWLSNLITSAGVGGILSQALVLLSLKYFDSRLSRTVSTTARVLERVREEVTASGMGSPGGRTTDLKGKARSLAAGVVGSLEEIERDVLDRAVQVLSSPGSRSWLTPVPLTPSSAADSRQSPFGFTTAPPTPGSAGRTLASSRAQTPSHLARASPQNVIPGLIGSPAGTRRDGIPVDAADFSSLELPSRALDADLTLTPEPSNSLASLSMKDLRSSLSLALHYYSPTNWKTLAREFYLDTRAFLIIATLYMVPIIGAVTFFAPFYLMYQFHPLPWYFYTGYGTIALMYLSTYRGRPSLTGSRSWPAFRRSALLWGSMERYFDGKIIPQGELQESAGPYIFGFHPHGIYPMTCFWATHGQQFRSAYPGLTVDVCAASIMFHAPILREIIMWAGGREVSGSALRYALKSKRSVMLIPGGQREMRHSKSSKQSITMVTRHRGFIRMAMEHGTPLVPVLSIGETMLLENIDAPRMQAYTLRTVGVGFPIWPYGRWYSPMPNAHPVLVVYGHPIPVEKLDKPSNAQLDEVHTRYYSQLKEMFEEHKHLVPGFEHTELVYTEE
jgi:hypothetical protein